MIEFEKFFAGEFQRRLEQTTVPGMADASWDRKAAWLLWLAEQRKPAPPTPPSKSVFD